MSTEKKHISTITSLVDKLHNIMREEQIVGHKAYLDISKMLFLRFIQPHIKPNGSLYTLVDPESYKVDGEFIENYEEIVLKYLDITKLWELPMSDNSFKETVLKIWKRVLAKHPLTKDIFQPQDFFNTKDFKRIRQCLFEIDKALSAIEFDKLTYDVKGVIYEHFLNGYASKAGKEFGQFFTPRSMVNMIFDINSKYFPEMKVNSIYDPCMGTAGFLTEMYKQYPDINTDNIHGGELEPDTYASALMNLLLTTGSVCKAAKHDSLRNNSNIEFDWICTNPPFGIKGMKYDVLLSSPTYADKSLPTKKGTKKTPVEKISIPMKELYPIKTNDPAALFLQHCMGKLADDGVCNIVLPDGQIMTGKAFKKLRQFLIEQYTLKAVIQVPNGAFTHAGIKTSVLIFANELETCTDFVDFYETSIDCLTYKLIQTVSLDEFQENDYSLDCKSYVKSEEVIYDDSFEMKKIGDICKLLPTTKHCTNIGKKEGLYRFYNSSDNIDKLLYLDTYEIEKESVIIGNGGNVNVNICSKFTASKHVTVLQPNDEVLPKYLYYYLSSNRQCLKEISAGATIKWINKTNLSSVEIPIPSLEKQLEIITDYEMFDELAKNYMDTIQLLYKKIEIYKKLHIKSLFKSHTTQSLGEICDIIIGFTPSTKREDFYINGTIKWACISDMKNMYITDTVKKITPIAIINKSGKLHRAGTVLLSFKLSIGKVSFATCDLYTNEAIAGINSRSTDVILNEYIAYYLVSTDITQDATGVFGPGSLNKEKLRLLQIPVPSVQMQKEIILKYKLFNSEISEINEDIEICNKKIKNNMLLQKQLFGIETVTTASAEDTMESAEAD